MKGVLSVMKTWFRILAVLLLYACNSPLDIDTPRTSTITDFTVDTSGLRTGHRVSLVLAFDVSSSMRSAELLAATSGARSLVGFLDDSTDDAAVLMFARNTIVKQCMTTRTASLVAALDSFPIPGASALWDGCVSAIDQISAYGANTSRAVIVSTDGRDNASVTSVDTLKSYAVVEKVPLNFIGSSGTIQTDILQPLATATGGNVYALSSTMESMRTYLGILRSLRVRNP
jgi:Mg-chelatase subunit ChlD